MIPKSRKDFYRKLDDYCGLRLPHSDEERAALACVAEEASYGMSPREAWRDGQLWTVYAPAVPFLYTGKTRREATENLVYLLAELAVILRGKLPPRQRRSAVGQEHVDALKITSEIYKTHSLLPLPRAAMLRKTARVLTIAAGMSASTKVASHRRMLTQPYRDVLREYTPQRVRCPARRTLHFCDHQIG